MAWGASTSIDGWLNKLSRNDPSFTSLHVLSSRKLTQNQFQELFAALSSNTSLAEFNASGHFLDHRSLEVLSDALSNNEHIKSLCIGNCELRDEGVLFIVQGLKNNKSLEVLDLEYKGIGNDGCVALAQLISVHSSLKDIRLSRNSISDEGFVSLFSNLHRSNIQKIDLGYNHVLGVGFDSFLIEPCNLISLKLDNNPLSIDFMNRLGNWVCQSISLQLLSISDCGLADIHIESFVSSISAWSKICLTEIDISNNSLSPESATAIASFISGNPKLKHFKASGNSIGSEGAIHILQSLLEESSLETLDLASNDICDRIGQYIGQCANRSLRELRLFNNRLNDHGIINLTATTTENTLPNLSTIDLSANSITIIGFSSLCNSLKQGLLSSLYLVEIGANISESSSNELQDGSEAALWESEVESLYEIRPNIEIAWKVGLQTPFQTQDPLHSSDIPPEILRMMQFK